MTLFFPDVNVWVALSVARHSHHTQAWNWLDSLPSAGRLGFGRFTQLGLLRLLTNSSVMGTLGQAWDVFDQWLGDPRVVYHPEPHGLDQAFRETTAPLSKLPASKAVGDSFLLAFARQSGATLVTFDRALQNQARKSACSAILPAR